MQEYLMKIKFDTNDADYIYGIGLVNEAMKNIIYNYQDENVRMPHGDSWDTGNKVKDIVSFEQVNSSKIKFIKKHNLHNFGEFGNFMDNFVDFVEVMTEKERKVFCEYLYS